MTRLLLLAVFLVSSTVAFYKDNAGQTVVWINYRQMELYNRGEYDQLVKELFSKDAIIRDGQDKIVAIGHDQIVKRLQELSGRINKIPIRKYQLIGNGLIDAEVAIDHTNQETGLTHLVEYKQRILNGKIILITYA